MAGKRTQFSFVWWQTSEIPFQVRCFEDFQKVLCSLRVKNQVKKNDTAYIVVKWIGTTENLPNENFT